MSKLSFKQALEKLYGSNETESTEIKITYNNGYVKLLVNGFNKKELLEILEKSIKKIKEF